MKTLFLCFMLVGLLAPQTNATASTDIPTPVTQSFNKKYPEVEDLSWRSKSGLFTANFYDESDGYFKAATFDAKGVWVETKTDADLDYIPEATLEFLETNYSDLEAIDSITKIEKPDSTSYLVVIEEDGRPETLLFDAKGRLVEED